ncbi:MAG: hypothetical protein GW946_00670 [Candidatus Pacebacteria bacterium]|nr:hypothetical protein [Candidatus Paceibacterota bacterium]PIR60873.1 MAG: hypothetical protein COU67_00245 [Candidatus Pacebacteria bacterium CG10_big_fil_rev_8_21_14_0_10_44_54]
MTNSFSKIASKASALGTAGYIALSNTLGNVLAQNTGIGTSASRPAPGVDNAGGNVRLAKGYADNVGSLITSVLTFVMLIAALLILMYLIWGGIQWITSGGDKGKTEEARNKITSAVIGLIILAAAWAVFLIVLKFLGFSNYNDLFNNIQSINTPSAG